MFEHGYDSPVPGDFTPHSAWQTPLYTKREKEGKLFGYFLIGLFSIRFIVEFVKESQGGIETFLPGLSTGQWLSIPFILIGIVFLFINKKKVNY